MSTQLDRLSNFTTGTGAAETPIVSLVANTKLNTNALDLGGGTDEIGRVVGTNLGVYGNVVLQISNVDGTAGTAKEFTTAQNVVGNTLTIQIDTRSADTTFVAADELIDIKIPYTTFEDGQTYSVYFPRTNLKYVRLGLTSVIALSFRVSLLQLHGVKPMMGGM